MAILENLNSLAMIFLLIIPGVIFMKKGLLNNQQAEGISSIVANLTWPCLVIDAMQISYSKKILLESGYTLVIMIIIFIIVFAIGVLLSKVTKIEKAKSYLLMFMLIFANTGFLGIPVIKALYGSEAVFFASIVELVNDIFLFTVGIMLIQLSKGAKLKADPKQLLSPGMIGVIVGFILFLCDYKLPGFLGGSIGILGDATTPLSMFIIGTQIGRIKIKELVGDLNVYIMTGFKLLIVPGITFVIMVFFLHDVSLLSKVIIMEFAMPVAACTVIFCQQYKSDVDFATKGVLLSTLFSIITIPIFSVLLELI